MKAIAQFVQTTVVGGLFFLAPIVVLIVILAKAFDYAKKGLYQLSLIRTRAPIGAFRGT